MRKLLAGLTALSLLSAAGPALAADPPKRKGGKVVRAWPAEGKRSKPDGRLERFLARQVGPRPITERMRRAARRPTARIAQAGKVPGTVVDASGKSKLALVRSYDIPADDPSAARLANLSWTYDSAISAVALAAAGEHAQARQLLDQLKALQRTDGSLDLVYDTATGASVQLFRSGTIAWVGYAALLERISSGNSKYNSLIHGTARWLLERQQANGLLSGGPDVSWVSTQHNMVAYQFLAALATSPVGSLTSPELITAANRIAAGIDANLTITPAPGQLGFVQGAADPLRPLDAQTLGVIYLLSRARYADALKVKAYIDATFRVTGRSITKSTATSTFNGTYAASGPFAGYRPYASGGPDVIWSEGSAQATWATGLLGLNHTVLDRELAVWRNVTIAREEGLLQADRTVTDSRINEYHVWPSSAATSWAIITAEGLPD